MKKIITTFCLLFLWTQISFSQNLNVPTLSPLSEISQEVALTKVDLSYARPSAKERKVFGELVPFGEVWRTGANASTKLTFTEDVKIAGNALKAGTYALYTIPNEKEWTIIIHNNTKHRSIAGDTYKQAEDAFRFDVQPEKIANYVETFTIEFADISTDECYIKMSWANTSVKFPIRFAVDKQVAAQIAELESATGGMSDGNYFRAAEYNFHNDKDLGKAVEWIKTALQKSPKNPRYGLLHAKILDKHGKKSESLKIIAESNAWAKEQNNSNYVGQTQLFWDSIKDASAQKDVDEKVKNIRESYTDISKRIVATEKNKESGKTSEIAVNEYVENKLDRSWAAVGTFRNVTKYYYVNREAEPYPDKVIKITTDMLSAVRTYYAEYVFDESENLIFYFAKTNDKEDKPQERRVYFDNGKAIRIIDDGKTRDELTKEDQESIEHILGLSKELRKRLKIFAFVAERHYEFRRVF